MCHGYECTCIFFRCIVKCGCIELLYNERVQRRRGHSVELFIGGIRRVEMVCFAEAAAALLTAMQYALERQVCLFTSTKNHITDAGKMVGILINQTPFPDSVRELKAPI